ncbi:hypothetical protein [Streptomyces sp. RFCAC02]|uniref:hypothetical protein n=1 Tax=Streptomyces sp. RFCAC02 TaxID=2499143 RepID=UPI0010218EDC|nr:hypothetical protein [Streptomyces sp. RFCAC02]
MVSARTRLSQALRAAAEEGRDEIVAAYLGGESLNSLCRRWGVSSTWLTTRLDTWGVQRRTQAEAFAARRRWVGSAGE